VELYVVHNRIDVAVEDAEAFEAAFVTNMRETLRGVPGLVRSMLMRPATDGQPYVATMEFASEDDFVAWTRSDAFKAAHANTRTPGVRAPSGIEAFTIVEEVRG
jgi:heme oxygenase (mycobilin-producing)